MRRYPCFDLTLKRRGDALRWVESRRLGGVPAEHAQSINSRDLPILGPGGLEPHIEYAQDSHIVDPKAFIDYSQIRAAGDKIVDNPAMDWPIAR